jgi:hypothetical protein
MSSTEEERNWEKMKLLLSSSGVAMYVSLLLLPACRPTSTATPVAVLPAAASTTTAFATPTLVSTPTPTKTRTPTPTETATPTDTPQPTNTPTTIPPTNTPTVDPDPDRDSISTSEENVYVTDPNVADVWNDFSFVSGILNTPDKVVYFMRHHMRFMHDDPGHNYFQNAQETFARGGGDCEDSAMFACEILNRNGWSFMGNGWGDSGNWVGGFNVQWVETDARGGHAVCLYKPSGQLLYYIDNDVQQLGLVRGPFANVEEVVADISARSRGEWRWYEFFDLNWNFGYGRVNKP